MLVRSDLCQEYERACMPATVTATSMLDLKAHWASIMHSLFLHNPDGVPPQIDIESFCIIGLYYTGDDNHATHGTVAGNLNARQKLIVLNYRDQHFDPCLTFVRPDSAMRNRTMI